MTPSPTLHGLRRSLVPGTLALALLSVWGCSGSTGPANSTNTAANANTTNRATQPANAANTAASNTSNTAASNTSNTAASGDVTQDFTLVNSTGVEINKLFISPHDKDDWEEDILGRDTLPSGQSVDIKFDRDEKAAMWDLRVEDSQGNSIVWENLNLLEISKITLHYENGRARAVTE
jgi:hypothetical protein